MNLIEKAHIKDQKTKEYLEQLTKSPETYVIDGNVFQKTEQGTLFLGPLSKAITEKCQGCEFLIKKPGRDTLSEPDWNDEDFGEVFWKGGCILTECVEEIVRERRKYAVSSHKLTKEGKKMLKSAWSQRQ